MCLRGTSSRFVSSSFKIRDFFDFQNFKVAQWFPGHMASGMKKMQSKLVSVDCIVEVHDARIPLSGRNPLFESHLMGIKPYILVLNKMDLIDMQHSEKIIDYYRKKGISNVLFTNCKDQTDAAIRGFIPLVDKLISNSNRFNRTEETSFDLMIIGVPNVGKSSLINVLRSINTNRGKGTLVGKTPGITRTVLEKIKICSRPPIYLLDTPGVLPPHIVDVETGLKLALINTIKNHLVGEDVIADYLLYRLNLAENYSYVDLLDLTEPTDDIQQLLLTSAIRNGQTKKLRYHDGIRKVPDIVMAANKFIGAFRLGKFGYLELDQIPESR